MAVCGCGAAVLTGRVGEGSIDGRAGTVLAFDTHEVTFGPGRYIRKDDGLFYACTEKWADPAYQDHQQTCAFNHRQPA